MSWIRHCAVAAFLFCSWSALGAQSEFGFVNTRPYGLLFYLAMANGHGPAFACQRLVDEGKVSLFVCPAVLEEANDIANRLRLQRKFKNLTPDNVEAFLEDVRAVAVLITHVPHV